MLVAAHIRTGYPADLGTACYTARRKVYWSFR